jgi:phospholipid/cholesterol/gamma-HCH transport system substrate-binding protein
MATSKERKVGLFVGTGILLLAVTIFMIGDTRQTWVTKEPFIAAFKNVDGLKPGAPVKLGGVDIGLVTRVAYGPVDTDTQIYVTVEVKKVEAVRIRRGTKASVSMLGMLGDKMLVLRVDDPTAPLLEPGGRLIADEGDDIIAKVQGAVEKVSKRLDEIGELTKPLSDPKFVKNLEGIASSVAEITTAVAHNDSAVHRLLMDPREGERIDIALANVDAATLRLASMLGSMQDVADHVRSGPGIAHAAIYDGAMSKNAATTLDEIRQDLAAIRTGNGLAHAVVYGDDNTQHVLGNVNAMSDDLRTIVAGIKEGRGTLGGLLVDPTIYEDLKSAVGNVERNQVLRALVRYSIKADENKPHPDPVVRVASP